jgi:hypothetical protein
MIGIEPIKVFGLKEALKQINSVNPKLRREITGTYKQIMAATVKDMQNHIPYNPPMSGFAGRWTKSGVDLLPWDGSIARKMVKVKIDTRRARNRNIQYGQVYETLAVFKISWVGTMNTIIDLAGKKNNPTTLAGANMIKVLNARYGQSMRFGWPAVERNRGQIDSEMAILVKRVMDEVNRNIVTNTPAFRVVGSNMV